MSPPNASGSKKVGARPKRSGWLRRQFSDVFYVARRDRKWWLLPVLFLVLLLATLLVAASTMGPLAPFVYPFL